MAAQGEKGRWCGGAYEVAAAAGSHVLRLHDGWGLWGQKSKIERCGSVLGQMRDVGEGGVLCEITGPRAAVI